MRRQLRSPGLTPDHAEGALPAGTIIDFAGSSAPEGFLVCDGTAYDKNDYPKLFAAIGILWGGDGLPNFNVPDLRDSFTKGKNADSVGNTGGSNAVHTHSVTSNVSVGNHTLIEANLPSHSHTINHTHGSFTSGGVSQGHTHTYSGTSSGQSQTHTHQIGSQNYQLTGGTVWENMLRAYPGPSQNLVTSGTSQDHTHTYSGTSAGQNQDHTHSTTVSAYSGSSGTAGSGSAISHSVTNNAVTSGDSSLNNLPKYATVLKVIKI